MNRRPLQAFTAAVVALIAMIGGWAATNAFQQVVPIVPGVQGCIRLDGAGAQTACLSDEFRNGADEAAGSASGTERETAVIEYVRRVESLARQDDALAGMCHPAMHQLGRDQGKSAATDGRVPEFPDGSTQLCTAGYVHGLAEGYVSGSPTADIAAVFPVLCHDEAAKTGCAHGLGHALLRAESPRRWASKVNDVTERCRQLPSSVVSSCDNGIYMEFAMQTSPAPVRPAEFVGACSAATDTDRELACWGYLGTNLASNDVPAREMPKWCGKAPLPGQFTCVEGYGRELGVDGVSGCRAASDRESLKLRCIDGAIGLQIGSGHVSSRSGRSACSSLKDRALVTYCRDAVERYARGRASVEREA